MKTMTVKRVDPSDTANVRQVLTNPAITGHFPTRLDDGWFIEFTKDVADGRVLAFLLTVDDEPQAVLWGKAADGGILMCHVAVLPQSRGWIAFNLARAACSAAFMASDDVKCLMGITPVLNLSAVTLAKRAGFREVGVVPGFFDDGSDGMVLARMR
jgi:ribosomal protein S18 acetylase RimI-like enzyme